MGNYIAGIFSVPKYKAENITALPLTVNDGIAMKELFIKHFGTDESNINLLGDKNNQEVQKTDILRILRHISGRAEPEDTLIFYFSGHGFSDGKIGYLATFEADRDFPSDTCISIPRIKEELNKSKAKRKMLIIDSCQSGMGDGKKFPSKMSKDFEESLFSDLSEGWVVFSSCKRNEDSHFLEDNSMSVFSFYLIEGLKGNADSNRDSIITLEDLNTYVTKKVLNWAYKNNKFQTPNINMESTGIWKFVIKNPEFSEPLPMESEIGITEGKAQSIVLESEYISPQWTDIYDGDTGEAIGSKEVPKEERIKKLLKTKKGFIGYLSGIMTDNNYCKPSQIKIKENDVYELPFGIIACTLLNPFEYEFKP